VTVIETAPAAPVDTRPYTSFVGRVSRVVELSSSMIRITCTGPEFENFGPSRFDQRIKLILPVPGRGFVDFPTGADWHEEWRQLPPDPYGTTYGFFDGHGWNMAFDHARNRLNGLYDFGDSGFGPLQQEFIYSNFVARDLTTRVVAEYEALTGRALDRERIELSSGVHRLSELAELADHADQAPIMIRYVADWAARSH
jgi:hypothetical protein